MCATAPLADDPDPEPVLAQARAWTHDLAGRMPLPWNLHQAIDALNTYLFRDLGFQGDRDTYDDPSNAVMAQVVKSRRGLPIALSILWVDLGRRLGLDSVGIALPAHFIVGLRMDTGILYFDPFHGGHPLGMEKAAQLVAAATQGRVTFDPTMLDPVDHRTILSRLVRNLFVRFTRAQAWSDALWAATHLVLLSPEDPLCLRDRALVHLERGSLDEALADIGAALRLRQSPDPELETLLRKLRPR